MVLNAHMRYYLFESYRILPGFTLKLETFHADQPAHSKVPKPGSSKALKFCH